MLLQSSSHMRNNPNEFDFPTSWKEKLSTWSASAGFLPEAGRSWKLLLKWLVAK